MAWMRPTARLWVSGSGRDAARRRIDDPGPAKTLYGAAAPDLNPQRETDRRFGAGQAAAPDGWDPSRRAAYSEIAGALEDFAMDSWQAL